MRLGNVGKGYDYECNCEDCHCDYHYGSGLGNRCIGYCAAYEPAYEYRGDGSADRVAGTSELDELVTLVSAAAQSVEHRIDYNIEHTHCETCNECSGNVNCKRLYITRKELDSDSHDTYDDSGAGSEFITFPLEDETCGDSHTGVSDKVSEGTQLGERLACSELIGYDYTH